MKHFLLLNLFIFIILANIFAQNSNSKNELIIGTEHNLNLGYPVHPAFEYSYSQSIYLQSELGEADVISRIWFEFGGSTLEHTNDWTIYIGHTEKNMFENNADWVDVNNLTEVYSGIFPNPTETGWIEFDIDDFSYNGTDNLIIAVDQNAEGSDMIVDNRFYTTSTIENRSMLEYSDSENIDPTSPPTNALLNKVIPNLKIFKGTYPDVDVFLTEIIAPENFNWIWIAGIEEITVSIENKGITNLTEVTFNWTVNGIMQSNYNWTGNLAPNESQSITVGSYNFSEIGDYEIVVEADVTNDGNSANDTQTISYEIINSFKTNYTEGFEDYLYPNTPDYWSVETHSMAWMVDDRISHSGENCLRTFYNEDGVTAKDDWAFLPFLNLVGGEEYQISFWVHAPGWNEAPESLEFYVGDETSSSSMTQKLWSNSNLLIDEWQEFSTVFTPAANANYVFGFHANSIADLDDIAIDDISIIGTTADLTDLSEFKINVYPNPSNGVIYISTAEDYNLNVFDISGKLIIMTEINKNSKLEIENPGIYFLNFSNSKRSVSTKVIVY